MPAGLRMVLAHRTIARRDRLAGWAHGAIFYGFLTLFAGTVILGFDTDFTEPVFGWNYFHGGFYLAYKEVLNVLGTALVAGVLVMMARRAIARPRKLDYARPDRAPGEPQFDRRLYRVGDWAFVGILLVIALTGFVLEGVRIAMDHPGYGGTQFGGWVVAQAFTGAGAGHGLLAASRHGLWWFHGLLAIAFVASIPYTKAAHMLSSFASARRCAIRSPASVCRRSRRSAPSEPAGYGALADFSPLHLLQLDACTKCGRCHEACPANATGRPLSPRDVILELREQANQAAARIGIGGVLGRCCTRPRRRRTASRRASSAPTACAPRPSGRACSATPASRSAPSGSSRRRSSTSCAGASSRRASIDPNLQSTLEAIHKSGNSFGENRRQRGRWTEELDFEVKDARKEPVDVLWFVGDYASFDPRSQRVSRSLARIFRAAGVDFGILYDGERNAGNDVRRVGEEGLFESLAEENIATLSGCEFDRIVTSDPHSLNTLRNEYPDLGGSWPVAHHTAFLLELLDAGALALERPLSYRVTYHDPCYLGRHNGGYDAPRAILERLGCTLVEMPRNRDNSFCCGAGGGRIWIPDAPGEERPSENRIREAVGLAEVELFVVACPKDVTMYEDAIKTSGNAERLALRELTELIEEAMAPAVLSGKHPR